MGAYLSHADSSTSAASNSASITAHTAPQTSGGNANIQFDGQESGAGADGGRMGPHVEDQSQESRDKDEDGDKVEEADNEEEMFAPLTSIDPSHLTLLSFPNTLR